MTSTEPRILWKREGVVAVVKPAGLATIPERDLEQPCLRRWLGQELGEPILVVHRLDKGVSGVLLFATDTGVHRTLNRLFEQRRVEKHYEAVVWGRVGAEEGQINAPLRLFGSGRMGVDAARGKASTTEFRTVDRGERTTHLALQPRTGRRHQLRVHLHHIGHAIVGDPRYGDPAHQRPIERLLLHARAIRCEHEGIVWEAESELPSGFDLIRGRLEAEARVRPPSS